jgi:hypothetical protein
MYLIIRDASNSNTGIQLPFCQNLNNGGVTAFDRRDFVNSVIKSRITAQKPESQKKG